MANAEPSGNGSCGGNGKPRSILETVLDYHRAGLCTMPVRIDGSKAPILRKWEHLQKALPTERDLDKWFGSGQRGIAVICGRVSGNLETLDFETEAVFSAWAELVEAQAPGLVGRLSVAKTLGHLVEGERGVHARYRCPAGTILGNLKLAYEPRTDGEGKVKRVEIIETRGEGGYAIAPGSDPRTHSSGRPWEHFAGPPLTALPEMTPEERRLLLETAASLNRWVEERPSQKAPEDGPLRPGDDYDRRGPAWETILGPHGWEAALHKDEVTYWRRPGKEAGWSATTGFCRTPDGLELLAVFSTSAHPFEVPSGRSCGCFTKFAALALLNHGGDFRAAAKALAKEGYGDQRHKANGRAAAGVTGRPQITITTEEHEVNAEAVAALVRDPAVYQRGGLLVRVVRDESPAAKGIRRPFAPRIETLPPPLLRERLAANAQWVSIRETKDGPVEQPARPPAWCVAAVHARADWPGIRHLEAVVDYPVLRPDGTILSKPGYDPETGLLLDAAAEFPAIPDRPTRAEAVAARDELLEVIADFPFERGIHKAAYVAALLTPLARFAFEGPAPLFLTDANVRAAGKGLLLDTISHITTGERFTIATYTSDEDELRKRITSLVLAGDRLVLFDNLEGKFGNAVLDAALTGTAWKDRVLGVNRMAEAPLYMTWYATGNNVAIAADTARRVCHIRLESPDERPEERQGFRHRNLLAWVGENRARLLKAALTILRAYCADGRPDQGLPAWGSFEGWSGLVRAAVVWVGLPDPGETRLLLQEQADVAAESMGVVLACWERLDPARRGLTAAEVIQLLKEPPGNRPDYYADLRDAVEALVGRLDARGLGNRLRSYRRRVFGGRFIDQAGLQQRAARWAVFPAADFRRRTEKTHETHQTHSVPGRSSECGESGESFSPETVSATANAGPETAWEGNGEAWDGRTEAWDGHGDAWEGPTG